MPSASTLTLPILLKIVRQTDGRDKLLKIIQYFSKVLFLVHLSKAPFRSRHPKVTERTANLISAFSTARKIIRLGHCIEPYSELHPHVTKLIRQPSLLFSARSALMSIPTDTVLELWNAFLSVVNDLSDDVVCLAKIGVVDKETGKRMEPVSNWLWLTCIALDLYGSLRETGKLRRKRAMVEREEKRASNGAEAPQTPTLAEKKVVLSTPVRGKELSRGKTEPALTTLSERSSPEAEKIAGNVRSSLDESGFARRQQELATINDKLHLQRVSTLKLLADLGFCAYDVVEAKFSDQFQASCALTAGILAMYKLWKKAQY